MPKGLLIHTIGHSDHDTPSFVALLRRHEIVCVVDVRSQPYSQWAHQFNSEILARDLQDAGIAYTFMGDSLGGRPSEPALYDPGEERPDYQRMEQTAAYQNGMGRLLELAQPGRAVLMCGEGDHRHCHRHLLIAQTLLERGVGVRHIQPDGTIVKGEQIPRQLSLFG